MTIDHSQVQTFVESLRNVGLVSRPFPTAEAANEWRSAMRRAAQAQHLRVRTFIWPERDKDGAIRVRAYIEHRDRKPVSSEEAYAAVEALPTPPHWRAPSSAGDSRRSAGRRSRLEQPHNVYMEITRRDDIGTDLKAPATARGGVPTPGYALVPLVHPGDVVIHYDSRQEAIVGVSVAADPAESAPIYWVARGTYARRAGEQPRWLPGIRVPLHGYERLPSPITLAQIRAEKDQLLTIRARIQASSPGTAIYFPWIPYRDTLRTFQSYLVKMPQEAITLFPELRAAVEHALTLPSTPYEGSAQAQAEKAVGNAAGKLAQGAKGQGFQLDQEVKAAIEAHAMNVASEFYATVGDIEDVHGRESYDLVCRHGNEIKHIEVKGTTTDGVEVILTPNEVAHARAWPNTALFILRDIKVERTEDSTVQATGGVPCVHDPWDIKTGTLIPIGYRYQVPALPTLG